MKKNKTYKIFTIGCQMNQADSERLATYLETKGFRSVRDFKQAGVIILNTCGVKQSAEDRAYGLVNEFRRHNKKAQIVITGCLSRREDVKKRLVKNTNLFIPISEMSKLPELLEKEGYNSYFSLDKIRLSKGEEYLNIPPKHQSKFTAYVPIGNGCNNFCSYCVVPYARGAEVYRPASDIIKEVRALVKSGYKEIILIAQNVNSYQDKEYNFAKLLFKLIKIRANFWLRFSSSHPKDMSDELIKILGSSSKICSHLHLAVQSGDDDILKAMNRKYTVAHYRRLIKKVRAAKPGIAITTDIIVGFPGETRLQFEHTLKLFKDINFDLAYISPYSPRPGTAAYQMKDDVSYKEKRRRLKVLNDILKQTALANHQKMLGKKPLVLVEGKNKRGKYYAKASSYQTVLFTIPRGQKTGRLIGEFVQVEIKEAFSFGLEGVFIKKVD